jgi:hypothetical protein
LDRLYNFARHLNICLFASVLCSGKMAQAQMETSGHLGPNIAPPGHASENSVMLAPPSFVAVKMELEDDCEQGFDVSSKNACGRKSPPPKGSKKNRKEQRVCQPGCFFGGRCLAEVEISRPRTSYLKHRHVFWSLKLGHCLHEVRP